ncbi:hypothetical protein, partial [Modestobacter marinus]
QDSSPRRFSPQVRCPGNRVKLRHVLGAFGLPWRRHMLPAAVFDTSALAAIVWGVIYVIQMTVNWQEGRSMIKKTPAGHIVQLARALNSPRIIGRRAEPEKPAPPAD